VAQVRIVLVRPENPVNVGAVARIVRNTGLSGMDLVAPGDWRTVECWRTAWRAQDVLEQARVFASLGEALAETALAVGLSGRRDAGIAPLDVREAAEQVVSLDPEARAALVLGAETSGLSRDELALCALRARIPTHPDQPSLNLSHAAMVVAYEVYRAGVGVAAPPGPRLATHGEKEQLLELLEPGLRAVGAVPPRNAEAHLRDWTALVHRAPLTPREVKLLAHLARKLGSPPAFAP
jgi:tRNA/rRNA methyltransferase